MLPRRPFLVRTLYILTVVLPLCGSQLYVQHLDPGPNPLVAGGAAVRFAAAAKVAAAKDTTVAHVIPIPPPTAVGTFTTFDLPGFVDTFTTNDNGAITGFYSDSVGSGFHGFVRAANGSITTFDVPLSVNGTFPSGISNNGAVTGSYGDNVGSGNHGFVLAANGKFATFDALGGMNGTGGVAINSAGTVLGIYIDAGFIFHCLLRTKDGALTTVDPPNAINGCSPSAITPDGEVLGIYTDGSNIDHAFVRSPSGTSSDIGPNGATGPFEGSPALSINPQGVVAGSYFKPMAGNPFGGDILAFVQYPNGTLVTFDAANYSPCCVFSWSTGINPGGTVTGLLNDGFNLNRGFLRTPDGTISTFDAPGAGTGFNQGTLPWGITPGGVILGTYRDANFVSHGFTFRPQ
jgi:hypothetical protein